MKFKSKKLLVAFLVAINIFSLAATPALAWDMVGLANPIGIENQILEDLGVNKAELRNTIQSVNVSRRKKNPPQLSLTFDPTDPVPGEKVTVTAMPSYFLNTTEDLYFTWYLKSKRCYDKALDGDDYKNKFASGDFDRCNLDGDKEVDIEDYKIKAMRILANDDFAWDDVPDPYSSKNTDSDGYQSVSGGDDQRGKEAYCFIHDVESGDEYALDGCGETRDGHLFPHAPDDTTGDDKFGLSEERFWHTDPENNDTASTGNTDEANVAGLGENEFTFTYTSGDKVGVVVEGVSIEPTQVADASYKTMWAFTKNKCDVEIDDEDAYPKTTGPTIATHTNTDFSVAMDGVVSLSTASDYTTTTTTTTVEEIVPGTQVNENATIRTRTTILYHAIYTDPNTHAVTDPSQPDHTAYTSTCPTVYSNDGSRLALTENGINYICTGLDEINQNVSMTKMTVQDLNDCLYDNLVTPAEGGGATEKLDVSIKYLPENPINDASGRDNGDTLSFTASVPNATNIGYLNYTWQVYASDEPNPDSWGSAISIAEASQLSGLGLDTFKFNLNFSDPKKYLKIKVTVKDTLTEDGDQREGHTDVVVPIFSSEERIHVYTAKYFHDLDTGDPIITLPATEDPQTLSDVERCLFEDPENGTKTPRSSCEVAKHELIAMEVENEGGKYSDFVWVIDGKTHICSNKKDSLGNYIFTKCLNDEKATPRTYFPILKNPGDHYTVEFSMLNTETGERLSLSRIFNVMIPEAKIVPVEKVGGSQYTCRGLLLGKYIDFNGEDYDDRSDRKFQALTSSNIELVPTFTGTEALKEFTGGDNNPSPEACPYQWNVDGKIVNALNATSYGYSVDLLDYGKLILPPKNDGEKYLISFSTMFTPDNGIRQVLNEYWDVTYNEFYEKKLIDGIEIEMVSTEIAKKETSPKKILATVSSGIPNYFSFLFRMVLSGMAIILALKIIFFILPKAKNDEF